MRRDEYNESSIHLSVALDGIAGETESGEGEQDEEEGRNSASLGRRQKER